MVKSLSAKRPAGTGGSLLKGGKVLWAAAIVLAVAVAASLFAFLNQMQSTVTYYVLNQPVPARTLITTEMLHPVTTAEGGQPRNAWGPAEVGTNSVYSKFALNAGDVVSASNAGPLTPINTGIPDNFVVASFAAPAESAVAGRIKRGDYIDIIALEEDPETEARLAKYVLRSVLVLDVNSDLSSVANAEAAEAETGDPEATPSDSAAARSGVPALYTVGVSREDALTLALIADSPVFVVLSSVDDVRNGVQPEDISRNHIDLFFGMLVGDSGIGTDATFGDGEARGVGEGSEADPNAELSEGTPEDASTEAGTTETDPGTDDSETVDDGNGEVTP